MTSVNLIVFNKTNHLTCVYKKKFFSIIIAAKVITQTVTNQLRKCTKKCS